MMLRIVPGHSKHLIYVVVDVFSKLLVLLYLYQFAMILKQNI